MRIRNVWPRRWGTGERQRGLTIALILLVLGLVVLVRHDLRRDHYLQAEDLQHLHDLAHRSEPLTPSEIAGMCQSHGFAPCPAPRKVYDLFLFNTEFDWLDIRLNTLAPFVDSFVIVESPHTFSTRPKPLYLAENWDRVQAFHSQILYANITVPQLSGWLWHNEDYLRNALLSPLTDVASLGDVLLVSDIDELPRPETLFLLRHCAFPARLTLRSNFFSTAFTWRRRGPLWAHPQATTHSGSSTLLPNDLRMGLVSSWSPFAAARRWWDRATLWNAGWHCTSCFATIREVQNKLDSFSHATLNTPANRDPATIVARVRNGTDLFARQGEDSDWVGGEANLDVPEYVLQQYRETGRFGYLVDRSGEGAGFEDWDEMRQQAK